MTRRMIDATVFMRLGRLNHLSRLLYIGIVVNADDQGRIYAAPAYLRSIIFPTDDIPLDQIEAAIEAMAAHNIVLYSSEDGVPLIQIGDWWDIQALQYAAPSKYPPPPGWKDQIRYTFTKGTILTYNWERRDGSLMEDTCDAQGRKLSKAAQGFRYVTEDPETVPPVPKPAAAPASGQKRGRKPTTNKQAHERDMAALGKADLDPRKFVDGRIPEGQGATPLEVFFEIVNVNDVKLSDYNKDRIREKVTDLERWRSTVKKWMGVGYFANNITGILDWYENGTPTRSPRNNTGAGSSDASRHSGGAQSDPTIPGGGTRANLDYDEAERLFGRT